MEIADNSFYGSFLAASEMQLSSLKKKKALSLSLFIVQRNVPKCHTEQFHPQEVEDIFGQGAKKVSGNKDYVAM